MKTNIKNLFLLTSLIAGFSLMRAGQAAAQTLTPLHIFWLDEPIGATVLSGSTLYGVTLAGPYDGAGAGTIFTLDTNAPYDFNTLYTFTGGIDGANPHAGLILSGDTLYGTTLGGGANGNGTVFSISTNGGSLTTLYSFAPFTSGSINGDGARPAGPLILSGSTLYGTTWSGGTYGVGTVFSMPTNGVAVTTLHHFNGTSDGGDPLGGLVLSGSTLYGTANQFGDYLRGTVFSVTTSGSFSTLYNFGENNANGAFPVGSLLLLGSTLYGVTAGDFGTHYGYGTVFSLTTAGGSFTTLHNFSGSDGNRPYAGLISDGATLYGTTELGGDGNVGTVFGVNTSGSSFTVLHSFDGYDGAFPEIGSLLLSDGDLYGTTIIGGPYYADGTLFRLTTIPPAEFVAISGADNGAIYSYDGINWYSSPGGLPYEYGMTAVCYGDGVFVAVGNGPTWGNQAAYSTDGINWSASSLPASDFWTSVTYGNGEFVAIGGYYSAAYSYDGIHWTASSGGLPAQLASSVAYGNGAFMTVFQDNWPYTGAWYSSDGDIWSASYLTNIDGFWDSVTYGNGEFVAVGYYPDEAYAAYSTDGINWSASDLPGSETWISVVYGNGTFVAISEYDDNVVYSTDGVNWSATTIPYWDFLFNDAAYCVACGNGLFVVVGDGASEAYSTDGINWSGSYLPYTDCWVGVAARQ